MACFRQQNPVIRSLSLAIRALWHIVSRSILFPARYHIAYFYKRRYHGLRKIRIPQIIRRFTFIMDQTGNDPTSTIAHLSALFKQQYDSNQATVILLRQSEDSVGAWRRTATELSSKLDQTRSQAFHFKFQLDVSQREVQRLNLVITQFMGFSFSRG